VAKTKKISKAELARREKQSKESTVPVIRANPFAIFGAKGKEWELLSQGVSHPAYTGAGLMDKFGLVNWFMVRIIGNSEAWLVGKGQATTHHNITLPKLSREQLANLPSQPNFQEFGVTPGKI
jgi:hypothetical protein